MHMDVKLAHWLISAPRHQYAQALSSRGGGKARPALSSRSGGEARPALSSRSGGEARPGEASSVFFLFQGQVIGSRV